MADSDDLRAFTRDLLTRFERRTDAIVRRMDAQADQMREQAAAMREQAAAMRDMRAEIRANTQGLLRVLDEMRGQA